MKRFRILSILLLSLTSCHLLQAQAKLGISNSGISINDTVYTGSNYPLQFTVVNKGDSTYQGPLTVFYQTDVMVLGTLQPKPLVSLTSVTLLANNTFTFNIFNFNIDSAEFKPQNTIVVVWPVGNSISTSDSAAKSVVVLYPLTGIENITKNNGFVIYPNPASQSIYIRSLTTDKNNIEQVRIIDINGVVHKNENLSVADTYKMDVSDLSMGIYFIEVKDKKGKLMYDKVIITK